MAVNSQSRLKMITAHEWDRDSGVIITFYLSLKQVRSKKKKKKKQHATRTLLGGAHISSHRDTHAHTKEHILTCADILDRQNYKKHNSVINK